MKCNVVDFKRQKCWILICKKCKKEIEDGDYTPHFSTKKEALEYLDHEGGEDYISLSCCCGR